MLWIHRGGTGLDGRPYRTLQRVIEMSRGWEGARTRDFGLSRSIQPQHGPWIRHPRGELSRGHLRNRIRIHQHTIAGCFCA